MELENSRRELVIWEREGPTAERCWVGTGCGGSGACLGCCLMITDPDTIMPMEEGK